MTILYLLTFAAGVAFGGLLVYKFNPKDLTVNGNNKVKNGGVIDFISNIADSKPENKKKDGLLTRIKNRRNKK